MPRVDLRFDLIDLTVELLEMVKKPLDEHAKRARQPVVSVFDQLWNSRSDVADTLGNDETELAEKAANLIGLRRTGPYEALAYSVAYFGRA